MNNYDSIFEVRKAWLETLGGDPSPADNTYEVSLLLLDWYLNQPVPPVPPVPPIIDYDGLIFTALENGSSIAMTNHGENTPNLQYSFDCENWETWDYSEINLTDGQEVAFKGTNTGISSSNINYSSFVITGDVEAKGDIMSLLDDGACTARTISGGYSFYALFSGCTSLTTAPELPATTLGDRCYSHMFEGCSSIKEAAELPATTLAQYCYEFMYNNCTSLVTVPSLAATSLEKSCYNKMFGGCSSIKEAAELPATTLAPNCYQEMFSNCTSLVEAPFLPASAVPYAAYYYMFAGCTSLSKRQDVLPATSLGEMCYSSMFRDCSSLKTAPVLPATTLVERCYYYMFYGCSKLNDVKMFATSLGFESLTYWAYRVSSAGTLTLSTNAWWKVSHGSNGCPPGWVIKYSGQTDASSTVITLSSGEVSTNLYIQVDSYNGNTWEITDYPAWCTLSTTVKTDDRTQVVVTAQENTGSSRSGNMIINATDRTITIPITQSGSN